MVEAPLLAKLNLTVLNTDAPMGFISSDRPVVWWDPTMPKEKGMFGIGLGNANIEITVPISPRQKVGCCIRPHPQQPRVQPIVRSLKCIRQFRRLDPAED